jgi:hypothetical protein
LKVNPVRRALVALAALAALAVLALGVLSLPWRAARPPAPPAIGPIVVGAGPLQAGAAVRTLDLGPAPLIGGFPKFRWAAEGVEAPLTARALVLAVPGMKVALASVEVLVIPGALDAAVRARVADLKLDGLVLAATHTHAGPGGYWDSLPGEVGATGPYDPATFERLVGDLAAAIRAADRARVPAALAVARGRAEALVLNRNGAAVDGRLLSVRLTRADGAPLAELVGFTAHPTLLGVRNRTLSGDWVANVLNASSGAGYQGGGAATGAGHGPRLFFQGPIGDQSVRIPDDAVRPGESLPAAYGRLVNAALERLIPGTGGGTSMPGTAGGTAGTGQAEVALGQATATVTLPPLSAGALPAFLRPAARTLLGGSLPSIARITVLRLGPLTLVATPAEPVEAVGRSWREAAGHDAELISLSGDYVGYVDTAARFAAGAGEARRSYYGPELAARLEDGIRAAAAALDAAQAAQR